MAHNKKNKRHKVDKPECRYSKYSADPVWRNLEKSAKGGMRIVRTVGTAAATAQRRSCASLPRFPPNVLLILQSELPRRGSSPTVWLTDEWFT